MAINRAIAKSAASLSTTTTKCVFISHQKEDEAACEKIADYLINSGVDVYFDKFDSTLKQLVQSGNASLVTQQIKDGINKSTHMICVVSPSTVKSYWVPFEVGFGYDRKPLGVLTLKGILDADLPDYMKTTRVLRGTKSLNQFIAELLGDTIDNLARGVRIKKATDMQHPLDSVLDWQQ